LGSSCSHKLHRKCWLRNLSRYWRHGVRHGCLCFIKRLIEHSLSSPSNTTTQTPGIKTYTAPSTMVCTSSIHNLTLLTSHRQRHDIGSQHRGTACCALLYIVVSRSCEFSTSRYPFTGVLVYSSRPVQNWPLLLC
jgi:hypothetical protein